MRPSSAETSEPACMKRKMLSMKSSTSLPCSSRKYSATVTPVSATRARAPGGSFIWPYTSAVFARTLADACENRHAAMLLRDVVDELHDRDGLADARAAEEPDFAAARIRADK